MTPARAALPLRLLVLAAAILGGLGGCDGNSEPATSPIESGPSALTAGTTALPLVFRYVSASYHHSCGVTTAGAASR